MSELKAVAVLASAVLFGLFLLGAFVVIGGASLAVWFRSNGWNRDWLMLSAFVFFTLAAVCVMGATFKFFPK